MYVTLKVKGYAYRVTCVQFTVERYTKTVIHTKKKRKTKIILESFKMDILMDNNQMKNKGKRS